MAGGPTAYKYCWMKRRTAQAFGPITKIGKILNIKKALVRQPVSWKEQQKLERERERNKTKTIEWGLEKVHTIQTKSYKNNYTYMQDAGDIIANTKENQVLE